MVPDFDYILRKEIQENGPSVQISISSYFQPVRHILTVKSLSVESDASVNMVENGSTEIVDPNFKCGNCDRSFFDKCIECSNAYCEACIDHHPCLRVDDN